MPFSKASADETATVKKNIEAAMDNRNGDKKALMLPAGNY
jgi:hypothetical protein